MRGKSAHKDDQRRITYVQPLYEHGYFICLSISSFHTNSNSHSNSSTALDTERPDRMVDYSTEVEQIYASLVGQPSHTKEQIAKIKKTIEFYVATFIHYDYARTSELVDKSYNQHSQTVDGTGLESIIEVSKILKAVAARKWEGTGEPHVKLSFRRILVDGEYVVCHIYTEGWPGEGGGIVIDVFRLENGKFVEHWDAIQEVLPHNVRSDTIRALM